MAGRHSKRGAARARIPEQREPAARRRAIGITDARTSVEHLVSDESVASHRHTGNYLALCGNHVLAASLTAPEGSRCRVCHEGAGGLA